MSGKRVTLLLILALAFVASALAWFRGPSRGESRKVPILGSVETLNATYVQWKKANAESGGDLRVVLPLHWSKGLSSEFSEATGTAAFDLVAGTMKVEVSDPCGPADMDVWLVDNQPGPLHTVMPEKGDRMVRAGRLEQLESGAALEAPVPSEVLSRFELDLVVVTPADRSPDQGGLLYGVPGLFQRLYSREMRLARGDRDRRVGGLLLAIVAPVPQDPPIVFIEDLDALIARGEDLFFNGTFAGNGRTCGTCHDAENNLTIDPPFIAGLPDDDPLFVAEFIPALNSDLNGGLRFEIPTLMREHGLILENLDGFGDLRNRFTMRGIPHTLGLNLSLTRPPNGLNPPVERTGWSGDGAPFDNVTLFGGLREFAVGAVTQHFPLTLARRNFQDFVLPTDEELDAMEAFQRSTGRQVGEELNIASMQFLNNDVIIGRNIFQDTRGPNVAGAGKCTNCHANAGANTPAGTNNNFNTGVEAFLANHPDGTLLPRPRDGGFGTNPQGNFTTLVPNADGSFGDKTFNTPPLVEAADSPPFFHNNITEITAGTGTLPNTIEGAVEFYTRAEFAQSPSGGFLGPIVLTPTQIAQVGKFLRVINALENERNARTLASRARNLLVQTTFDNAAVNRLLTVAIADVEDAIEVLEDVQIHLIGQQRFHQASQKLEGAKSGPVNKRIEKIDQAMEKFVQARADMITGETPFM
jgi:cytochrome c553